MSNDFTYQFAIQMPNGELLKLYRSSGLGSLFGLSDGPYDESGAVPRVFETRETAEAEIQSIKRELARKGIDWYGIVVQRLCTPFTMVDPAEHFAAEIQEWLQGGAS